MAARKKIRTQTPRKKKTLADRSPAREFTVVVEDLRTQFQVFGEALGGLGERMDARFERIDACFEQIDARFERIDARFEQIDARFDRIDARFDGVDREISLVKSAVLEHGRELRATKVTRDEVESIVERAMARR